MLAGGHNVAVYYKYLSDKPYSPWRGDVGAPVNYI